MFEDEFSSNVVVFKDSFVDNNWKIDVFKMKKFLKNGEIIDVFSFIEIKKECQLQIDVKLFDWFEKVLWEINSKQKNRS